MKKGIIIVNDMNIIGSISMDFPDWLVVYSPTNVSVQFIAKP